MLHICMLKNAYFPLEEEKDASKSKALKGDLVFS